MKHCLKLAAISFLLAGIALALGAATQTNEYGTAVNSGHRNGYYCIHIQSDDCNDFTATTREVYGYVSSVVVSANGDDAAYSVTIKDEHGLPIFTKADFNAATDPNRYSISEVDSEDSALRSAFVSVAGALTVEVADANAVGTTTDEVNVYIYTREYWQ